MIAALLSSGASLGAEGAEGLGAAAGAGTGEIIANTVSQTLKNPVFWTNALPTFGNTYSDAKDSGASEADAFMDALYSGIANGALEGSAGVGKPSIELPSLEQAFKTGSEEGLENILQGITQSSINKMTYSPNTPWYSDSDERAVFNPERAATEFLTGAVQGGFYEGGRYGLSKLNDSLPNFMGRLKEDEINPQLKVPELELIIF